MPFVSNLSVAVLSQIILNRQGYGVLYLVLNSNIFSGLYSVDGNALCLLSGQSGGLTQLLFSHDGSLLVSAGRKDSEILCWDLRNLGHTLWVARRPHTTNQRLYMDLSSDERYLLAGNKCDKFNYSVTVNCKPLSHKILYYFIFYHAIFLKFIRQLMLVPLRYHFNLLLRFNKIFLITLGFLFSCYAL